MITKIKKATLPIFAGFISVQISIYFCLGIIAGYLVCEYLSRKVSSIKISIGKYEVHLHHWIPALLGLAVIAATDTYHLFPSFVLGFGAGSFFHGIYCYNDWYKIINKKLITRAASSVGQNINRMIDN